MVVKVLQEAFVAIRDRQPGMLEAFYSEIGHNFALSDQFGLDNSAQVEFVQIHAEGIL